METIKEMEVAIYKDEVTGSTLIGRNHCSDGIGDTTSEPGRGCYRFF